MAWRDTRGSRARLVTFLLSMVLGVAALVAVRSFTDGLRDGVAGQARALLGADLAWEADLPVPDGLDSLAALVGGEQAERLDFPSMALFPRTGGTRLSTIRATRGAYPFYGALETAPAEAASTYLARGEALVDGALLDAQNARVGDSVTVGGRTYRIAGRVVKSPREPAIASAVSPRVYVPLGALDTALVGTGSRAELTRYFRLDAAGRARADALAPVLDSLDVGVDTPEETQADAVEAFGNLDRFLSLVAFVAVLLGGLGVGSSIHTYVKGRVASVAVLRCVGASVGQTVGIFLVQAVGLGLVAGLLGGLLGMLAATALPGLLGSFLPVEAAVGVSPGALGLGMGLGLGATVLFALLPLLAVRRVSPLSVLRAGEDEAGRADPLRWAAYAALALAVVGFAYSQTRAWPVALGYAGGVGVVLGALALLGRAVSAFAARLRRPTWPFALRQGLAALHRPRNQTTLLLTALGLGTFLLATLAVVRTTLEDTVRITGGAAQPNVVFFDVQPAQRAGVTAAVRGAGLPLLETVPIVTMRLAALDGTPVEHLMESGRPRWALRREYRSSYRSALTASEEVVAGTFTGRAPAGGPVPVSLEADLAADLRATVGTRLTWDVSGRRIETVVGSIRTVNWRRFGTNFFVVFPAGVLEAAPQQFVVLTRSPSDAATAHVQGAVVRAFPNVSTLDLSLALGVLADLFGQVGRVLRWAALLALGVGLVVLVGAVALGRTQRAAETVLLKTLGASRRQVGRALAAEYALLGLLGGLVGVGLALGAGWALARFVFESPLALPAGPLALLVAAVPVLTLVVGAAVSRRAYNLSPLDVLRREA